MQIEKAKDMNRKSRNSREAGGEDKRASMRPRLWSIFLLLGGLIMSSPYRPVKPFTMIVVQEIRL